MRDGSLPVSFVLHYVAIVTAVFLMVMIIHRLAFVFMLERSNTDMFQDDASIPHPNVAFLAWYTPLITFSY